MEGKISQGQGFTMKLWLHLFRLQIISGIAAQYLIKYQALMKRSHCASYLVFPLHP
jgi:hypothetical protein